MKRTKKSFTRPMRKRGNNIAVNLGGIGITIMNPWVQSEVKISSSPWLYHLLKDSAPRSPVFRVS
jgi:hypothetical protein